MSTLGRMDSGAVSLPRFRNTAVPGARITGGSFARSSSTNARSGPSTRRRSSVTSRRPRNQVTITVNRTMPIVSGNHAPCVILVRLAARKARSTVRKPPAPSTASHSGFPHRWRTMKKKRIVVIVIVAVTAIPKANASAAEV